VVRFRWSDSIWERVQAVTLWTIGAAASVHELFIRSTPQPEAYPLIAALIGVPFARAFDRARRERRSQSDPGPRK
jgi:hypothetical protein